jgi:amidase
MLPLAIGTQTFGSVIRPASYCGIVGYKPTFGTLPRAGAKVLADSLDTIGVFARTVADAALFAGAVAGSRRLSSLPEVVAPVRIGVCRTHEWDAVEQPGRVVLDEAVRALAAAGAIVSEVELPPPFSELRAANVLIYQYELARNLASERETHPEAISARLKEDIDAGASIEPRRYESAQRHARACREAFPLAMLGCDVLLTPSTTGEAPRGLESTGSPIMNRLWTLLHVPAVSVPARDGPHGLPIGVQVIGRHCDDARTLAVAAWIHSRLYAAG